MYLKRPLTTDAECPAELFTDQNSIMYSTFNKASYKVNALQTHTLNLPQHALVGIVLYSILMIMVENVISFFQAIKHLTC